MSPESETGESGPSVVSVRTMEMAVSLVFIAAAAVVIADSIRLGIGWSEIEGPASGYFPFYVGVLMALGSAITLAQALFAKEGRGKGFVGRYALRQVFLVLVPLMVYVAVTAVIGIYVSSALYIGAFMVYFGRYGWLNAMAVSVAITVTLFLVFEIWFLVPLPKGPVEGLLGY